MGPARIRLTDHPARRAWSADSRPDPDSAVAHSVVYAPVGSHGGPEVGAHPGIGEKVRKLSSCWLQREWALVLLSAGLSTRMWAQLASIRTFHRWLRAQRLSWPGVMPRSGVRGIGGTNRSNSQDLWIGDVSA